MSSKYFSLHNNINSSSSNKSYQIIKPSTRAIIGSNRQVLKKILFNNHLGMTISLKNQNILSDIQSINPSSTIEPEPEIEPDSLFTSTQYQYQLPYSSGEISNSNSNSRLSPYISSQHGNILFTLNLDNIEGYDSIRVIESTTIDGSIYFFDNNYPAKLYAYTSSGIYKWNYECLSGTEGSAVIGSDGTIYFGDSEGYFYAITGNGINSSGFNNGYQLRLEYSISTSPIIGSNGLIYIGDSLGNLYSIDQKGNIIWNISLSNSGSEIGIYDLAISLDSKNIYVSGFDNDNNIGVLFNISPNSSFNWNGNYYNFGINSSNGYPPICISLDQSFVYFIGTHTVWGVHATIYDFSYNWTYTTPTTISNNNYDYDEDDDDELSNTLIFSNHFFIITKPAISLDGTIYIGCNNQSNICALLAITPPTQINTVAILKWSHIFYDDSNNLLYIVMSSPVIDANGTIFFNMSSIDKCHHNYYTSVYAITDNGNVKWNKIYTNLTYNTPFIPTIGSNGVLYNSPTENQLVGFI